MIALGFTLSNASSPNGAKQNVHEGIELIADSPRLIRTPKDAARRQVEEHRRLSSFLPICPKRLISADRAFSFMEERHHRLREDLAKLAGSSQFVVSCSNKPQASVSMAKQLRRRGALSRQLSEICSLLNDALADAFAQVQLTVSRDPHISFVSQHRSLDDCAKTVERVLKSATGSAEFPMLSGPWPIYSFGMTAAND